MSRPLRLEFPGAVWHVTSRGNARADIYTGDSDRVRFLEALARTVGAFGWKLHAYVLMTNHYHLLLETPEPNLSRGMRQLNGVFAQSVNRQSGRCGHLFQGRFKGILVERQSHLLELTRYVVLNPVRAGIVSAAGRWPWSNYRATAGLQAAPAWLEVDWTLAQFSADSRSAREIYRRFVGSEEAGAYRPWQGLSGQLCLGGNEFVREIGVLASRRPISPEVPKPQRLPKRPDLARVWHAVAELQATGGAELASSELFRRAAFAYLARNDGGQTLGAIGRRLGVKQAMASRLATRGEALFDQSPVFRRLVLQIRSRLE